MILREKSIYLITKDHRISEKYIECPWSFVNTVYKSSSGSRNPIYYITTDLLVLTENGWEGDLKYQISEDPWYHEPRPKIELSFCPESKWIINLGEDKYIAFLSDWLDYVSRNPEESESIIKELKDHGYEV